WLVVMCYFFFFSSRRRHTRCLSDWSSDVCSSDLWGKVEVVCQRRADLVPNLVAIVQGYASHEDKVLNEVTQARSRVGGVTLTGEIGRASCRERGYRWRGSGS